MAVKFLEPLFAPFKAHPHLTCTGLESDFAQSSEAAELTMTMTMTTGGSQAFC
jgi:hypothetical protein